VYRTYIREGECRDFDRRAIETAIREAIRRNPVMEASIFQFIREVLLPEPDEPARPGGDAAARDRLRFTMKFQQFSGPVQAKGVEDTAFYRFHVLAAANDVGGHPNRLGVAPAAFHDANVRRLAERPFEMLATSTHDTKRGEDARMRLAVISELPELWRRGVSEWMRINARHRTKLPHLRAPDRNDEYLFYQAAIGAWPAEAAAEPVPPHAPEELVERLDAYMQKAIREAKVHTSWIDQNPEYGQAVSAFVRGTLTGRTAPRFLASFLSVGSQPRGSRQPTADRLRASPRSARRARPAHRPGRVRRRGSRGRRRALRLVAGRTRQAVRHGHWPAIPPAALGIHGVCRVHAARGPGARRRPSRRVHAP
jgi:(1->4)-alpha-D-glucan 1-alpha-D-glucosylmutase